MIVDAFTFLNEKELVELMIQEPDWDMLNDPKIVENLFHLNGHFNIVSKLKPKNIEQLAAVLAIIRPAKRQLMYKAVSYTHLTLPTKRIV